MSKARQLASTGLAVALSLAALPALAQTAPSPQSVDAPRPTAGDTTPVSQGAELAVPQDPASSVDPDEIVVTGTSIRGVAPVGSNLISVGREAIEDTGAQTIQQILKTVPAITAAGGPGQGQAGTSYYSPTIHSLGSSASNSTLVLIDGHRFPLGGSPHPLSDPNIIPPIALERLEVLAEGSSSIYGSDAVAGVINFITRKNYEGVMATGQVGFGDHYRTYNAGALWGTKWDTGSAMIAYAYSDRSALAGRDRDFFRLDHRPMGGTNAQSFNCSPATIQPQGLSTIYLSPTAATPVANTSANAPCDGSIYSDVIPAERRHNAIVKLSQEFGDNLTVGATAVYSNRNNHTRNSRGTVTATVFRTGAQANPFYVNPPGVLPGTTAGDRQTIRFDANELLGPGAKTDEGSENYFGLIDAEYRLGENFRITALGMIGRDDSYTLGEGSICGSCANLALNGTTNSGGSLTAVSVPGTTTIVTQLPLTAANALDVWIAGAGNRTSAATRARLVDNDNKSRFFHSIGQARLGIDGALFDLPGGAVRIAVGGEYIHYGLRQEITRSNNTGPASLGSSTFRVELSRDVKSAYGELLVPIIGPDNELPFARRVDINVSGRFDHYNFIGSTTNPKIAANWEVVEGLKLRGNYSESFVAPAITSLGGKGTGLSSYSGYSALDSGSTIIPIANYPLAAQLPGCTAPGQVTCTIATATVPGLTYNTGNNNLQPQTGNGWSVGVDLAPRFLPGFRAGVTLFTNKLRGGVTSPNLATVINTAGLNGLLTIYPTGATPAQIAAIVGNTPQTSTLPTTVYFIRNGAQQNVVNLDIQGIDADASYQFDTGIGQFTIGGSISRFIKFDQNIGGGTTFSVLNTTGFNETFPSLKTQARANIGWELDGLSIDLFANHIGAYRNWSTTTQMPLVNTGGVPSGGGDKVRANTLIDLHAAYKLSDTASMLPGSEIYLDVTNLFDRDPPFYNATTGYDRYAANPIKRVVSVGVRVKF